MDKMPKPGQAAEPNPFTQEMGARSPGRWTPRTNCPPQSSPAGGRIYNQFLTFGKQERVKE